jgi:hypothetical protein
MAALAWLIAHGGVGGAIVEALLALAVLGVLAAVFLRERHGPDRRRDEPTRLRDDEDFPSS